MCERAMVWYTITPNIFHPNGSRWEKRRKVDDIRVAMYAQTFPQFWVLPATKTKAFKYVGEAFPPLYARYLLLKFNASGKMLDMFAGIGGWSLGAILTGSIRYVEMVEIDREKCKYLELNFKQLKKFTEGHVEPWDYNVVCLDVREYEPTEKFDVVVGSPPCEDFSKLRALSKMFGVEIKGTLPLTSRYIELVDKIKPKIALYENVYALKIKELLEKHGYKVEKHNMFNIIPQRRVRLIAYKRW